MKPGARASAVSFKINLGCEDINSDYSNDRLQLEEAQGLETEDGGSISSIQTDDSCRVVDFQNNPPSTADSLANFREASRKIESEFLSERLDQSETDILGRLKNYKRKYKKRIDKVPAEE